jgi:hypothetical protein
MGHGCPWNGIKPAFTENGGALLMILNVLILRNWETTKIQCKRVHCMAYSFPCVHVSILVLNPSVIIAVPRSFPTSPLGLSLPAREFCCLPTEASILIILLIVEKQFTIQYYQSICQLLYLTIGYPLNILFQNKSAFLYNSAFNLSLVTVWLTTYRKR